MASLKFILVCVVLLFAMVASVPVPEPGGWGGWGGHHTHHVIHVPYKVHTVHHYKSAPVYYSKGWSGSNYGWW